MSSVRKGRYRERLVKKILELEGCNVYLPNWTRFGQKDILGIWDGLAFKPNSKPILFQVKSKKPNLGKYQDFILPIKDHVEGRVYVYLGNKKFDRFDV